MTTIVSLPAETLLHLFGFFTPKTLSQVAQVNKQFNQLALDPSLAQYKICVAKLEEKTQMLHSNLNIKLALFADKLRRLGNEELNKVIPGIVSEIKVLLQTINDNDVTLKKPSRIKNIELTPYLQEYYNQRSCSFRQLEVKLVVDLITELLDAGVSISPNANKLLNDNKSRYPVIYEIVSDYIPRNNEHTSNVITPVVVPKP